MEKIKITFLGTGPAIPTKERNHPAFLVSFGKENILVDCGEGTQRQFTKAGISPFKISKILITHWHGDHTLGLMGLFETLGMLGYKKPLTVYGPSGTKHYVKLVKEFTKAHKSYKINLDEKEVLGQFINLPEYTITAAPMTHGAPANAYSINLKGKIRINKQKLKKLKIPAGKHLKKLSEGKDIVYNGNKIPAKSVCYIEKGKKITFVLDTTFNKNAVKLAKNSDLLIAESSYSEEHKEIAKEYNHMTAKQAATIAKNSNSKKLILVHISERYKKSFAQIEKEAKSVFKNTKIAKDFETITV